jgi:RHS repeat-associated protein
VQRTETTPGGQVTVTRYGFTGDGDTPDFVLDGSSALTEWDLSLPGGVTAELRGSASSWSYPNIHGDIITTADGAGTRAAGLAIYDPFGQVEDPTTGLLGTMTANQAGPDTQSGSADYGWLGQHQKLSEHLGSIATIEMGARQYVAALGRFLQVDPIEGGTDSDYTYVTDPTNAFDLDGMKCMPTKCYGQNGKPLPKPKTPAKVHTNGRPQCSQHIARACTPKLMTKRQSRKFLKQLSSVSGNVSYVAGIASFTPLAPVAVPVATLSGLISLGTGCASSGWGSQCWVNSGIFGFGMLIPGIGGKIFGTITGATSYLPKSRRRR